MQGLPKAVVVCMCMKQHGLTVYKASDACDALVAAGADGIDAAAAAIVGKHSLRARLAASSAFIAVRIMRAAIAAALSS